MKVLRIETQTDTIYTTLYHRANNICNRQVPESILNAVLWQSAIVHWQGFIFSSGAAEAPHIPKSPITMGEHLGLKERKAQEANHLKAMQHECELEEQEQGYLS